VIGTEDHVVDRVINVADLEANHTTEKVVHVVGQWIVEVDLETDIGVEVGRAIGRQDIHGTDLSRKVRHFGIRKHRNVPHLHRPHQDRDQEVGHVIEDAVIVVQSHVPVQNHHTEP